MRVGNLEAMRRDGWTVALHNDHRIEDRGMTFWLFTHPCGLSVKGEAGSDAEAIGLAALPAARAADLVAALTHLADAPPERRRAAIAAMREAAKA